MTTRGNIEACANAQVQPNAGSCAVEFELVALYKLLLDQKSLKMKIAVEGCCHGELDKIYETIAHLEKKEDIKVDLLLCCGDFQAVRNEDDLSCMAVPPKYRHMQTFYKYYSGEKKAPVLTIFIGGNHEAANHLWELPYGGWVAPNIYYLGYAGVVNFGGMRIGGLSGIYKSHDYNKGHFERPPYNDSTVRSAYHIRSFDVFMLKLISQPIDIFLSHDWPQGVYHHGNLQELYRFKDFLKPEIESNTLGSPPAAELLTSLKPTYWFSAHLHTKFPALVPHESQEGFKFTKFLALDKCLPRREFLQVIDVGPSQAPLELTYDPEWLAITKLTSSLNNSTPRTTFIPNAEQVSQYIPGGQMVDEVVKTFGSPPKITDNFEITTTPYNPDKPKKVYMAQILAVMNPQTETFCAKLGINNPCCSEKSVTPCPNPEEIELSDGDENNSTFLGNPDEIIVDDDEVDVTEAEPNIDSSVVSIVPTPDVNKLNQNRSLLELPKPVNIFTKSEEHYALCEDDSPHTEGRNCEHEEVTHDSSHLEPQKKVLKIMRRNQTLYASNDNDEDSDA